MDSLEWIVQAFALPASKQADLYPDYMLGPMQLGFAWKVLIKERFAYIHALPEEKKATVNALTSHLASLDKEKHYKCWKKNGFREEEWEGLREEAREIIMAFGWGEREPQGFVQAKQLKVGRQVLINLPLELIRAATSALLGSVYPELRAIALKLTGKRLLVRYYLCRPVNSTDSKRIWEFEEKLKRNAGGIYEEADLECVYNDTPVTATDYVNSSHLLDMLEGLVYYRMEYHTGGEWEE